MRKTTRMQSAQALALAAACVMQVAAPGLAQAQTPAPTPVPTQPPTGTVATPPAAPAQPGTPTQAPPTTFAPIAPVPGSSAEPAPIYPSATPAPAAETSQPGVPAAAEPSAPPAYVEPLTTTAAPAPAETPVIEAAPTIDEQLVAEPKSKVPSYVMWGVGGASLITGAVLGITALTAKSDFDDKPTYAAADKVEGRAIAADIAFGLSAVLLVTGTVFYFMPDSQQERPTASNPKRTTARVQVVPMLGRTNGGAVSIQF